MSMKYLAARGWSFVWHLFYGMWRGYRETTTWTYGDNLKRMVAVTSTDNEWRTVKVFWEAD